MCSSDLATVMLTLAVSAEAFASLQVIQGLQADTEKPKTTTIIVMSVPSAETLLHL